LSLLCFEDAAPGAHAAEDGLILIKKVTRLTTGEENLYG
jgi:hypothetical protein